MNKTERKLAAQKRFFVTNGQGFGMKFYDPIRDRELTIYNVLDFINHGAANDDKYVKPNELLNLRWHSLLPKPVYRPFRTPVFIDEEGFGVKNLWREPEIKADASVNPAPFVDFLCHAFGETAAEYLLDWMAWQYQKPLNKPHTALYLYGSQGTGKGTLANILEEVFGNTAVKRVADQSKLSSMSSVDIWTRTLLIVEEVDVSLGSTMSNVIKSYTGTDTVDSDRKGEHFDSYHIPANLVMLSNHAPTFLERDDRRFYVKEMKPQDNPTAYFNELYQWLNTKGGFSAIAHLLASRDISGLTQGDRPPMTDEKRTACDIATKQDLLDVMTFIENNPNVWVFLPSDFRDICSADRLMHIAPQVGLKLTNLSADGKRSKTKCLTEAECKRLYILEGAICYKDTSDNNRWKIEYNGTSAAIDQKLRSPYSRY